ncbi:4,5-DOPA dioxygenase extradiol [Rheinheimera sp. F8]|uniref:4,5-DOPA-extradiol-dioxygenase n=1 Tax=Rheinheimera sp. F8 TaxID=1763998 RepID=UPI000AFDD259|nr:4,5-DOPA dioxygenase extradiol [Rheinheimera sp. F8]
MSVKVLMPMLFLGHGSPMNALESNRWTEQWRQIAANLKPKAILLISAHWDKPGLRVLTDPNPRTIHDFGGFPPALYQQQYPAPGSPALAGLLLELLAEVGVQPDSQWGFDHGAWSVLCHAFPAADVPVVQLSIDSQKDAAWHLLVGRKLATLRAEGVLIMASGNIVHNLALLDWRDGPAPNWAAQFLQQVQRCIASRDWQKLTDYRSWGQAAALAVPHPDHLLPLFYLLGAAYTAESLFWFNQDFTLGNLAMHSLRIGGQ